MDCGVCQLRSSVGFCAECKKLLCEVCGLAVFWAVVGLTKHEYEEDRRRSFIGLGAAVAAFLMAAFAVYTNPRPEAVVKFEAAEDGRGDMGGEELRGWREQRLQRFAGER